MNTKETIETLINKGVLNKIGREFFFTDRFEEIIDKMSTVKTFADLSDVKEITISKLYPEEIRKVSKRERIKSILQYCNVPTMKKMDNGKSYMLHTESNLAKQKVEYIISSNKYDPIVVLKTIKEYYKKVSSPKGFANFIVSDFFFLYDEMVTNNKLQGGKSNFINEISI